VKQKNKVNKIKKGTVPEVQSLTSAIAWHRYDITCRQKRKSAF